LQATHRIVLGSGLCTVFLLTIFFYAVPFSVAAETSVVFSSADTFDIPELNGSIRFVTNGSYTSATLQNNKWVFTNLALGRSISLGTLEVSAENSQVTIYQFFSFQNTSQYGRLGMITFHVDGEGKQSFNLGLNLNRTTHQSEWSIIVPKNPDGSGSDFLPEGKLWHLLSDNTVVVDGVIGNVTVAYFGFGLNLQDNRNLSFLEQHSVAFATIIIVAATIAVAAVIRYRTRRTP
jgi:hypothetical protein